MGTSATYCERNKVRQGRTEWHRVVVGGKRAEALSKILSKGSRIFVEGGLRTSSYDDKEGHKRYRTEVIANNVILAGGARGGGGGGGGPQRSGGGDDYGGSEPEAPQAGGGGYDDQDYGGDDNIPF